MQISSFDEDCPGHKHQKHKALILEKSGLKEEEFNSILKILFEYIQIISYNFLKDTFEEAKDIMAPIDKKDVIFLAAAMALENALIWSEDKDFKKQNLIPVKTTKEMLKDQQ